MDGTMKLITLKEAARMLHVSLATMYRWTQAGRIPIVRIGYRTIRIDSADLERLINDLKVAA